jgi:hypothetical protein
MQGAKSKARLDALPDFATPQTARKSACPAGWGDANAVAFASPFWPSHGAQPTGCASGRFAHQIPCMGIQPMLRDVGGQLIPIAPQRGLK